MIDKETLDAVLPLPELEERRDELVAELKEAGFVVTNFHSGGIFYTLLMIVLRIEREYQEEGTSEEDLYAIIDVLGSVHIRASTVRAK